LTANIIIIITKKGILGFEFGLYYLVDIDCSIIVVEGGRIIWNHWRAHQYSKLVSTINWMTSSKYLIICVICNKCIIHSYSHLSWHGKGCSSIWKGYQWKTITSSNAPMKLRFRNGKCISCPIMFSSPRYCDPKCYFNLKYNCKTP